MIILTVDRNKQQRKESRRISNLKYTRNDSSIKTLPLKHHILQWICKKKIVHPPFSKFWIHPCKPWNIRKGTTGTYGIKLCPVVDKPYLNSTTISNYFNKRLPVEDQEMNHKKTIVQFYVAWNSFLNHLCHVLLGSSCWAVNLEDLLYKWQGGSRGDNSQLGNLSPPVGEK